MDLRVWLVIPIRSLADGKQRLAPAFGPAQRARLIQDWFHHLLDVARTLPELAGIVVVSRDPQVRAWAAAAGALAIPDPDAPVEDPAPAGDPPPLDVDLNRAVRAGIRVAQAAGADAVLVLPGDLPHVTGAEVRTILAAGRPAPRVVLAPSHDGGTNALYLAPPDVMPPVFGPGSFHRHLIQAQVRRVLVTVVRHPALAWDVDHPRDLVDRTTN